MNNSSKKRKGDMDGNGGESSSSLSSSSSSSSVGKDRRRRLRIKEGLEKIVLRISSSMKRKGEENAVNALARMDHASLLNYCANYIQLLDQENHQIQRSIIDTQSPPSTASPPSSNYPFIETHLSSSSLLSLSSSSSSHLPHSLPSAPSFSAALPPFSSSSPAPPSVPLHTDGEFLFHPSSSNLSSSSEDNGSYLLFSALHRYISSYSSLPILPSNTLCLWLYDLNGICRDANDAALRSCGFHSSVIFGRTGCSMPLYSNLFTSNISHPDLSNDFINAPAYHSTLSVTVPPSLPSLSPSSQSSSNDSPHSSSDSVYSSPFSTLPLPKCTGLEEFFPHPCPSNIDQLQMINDSTINDLIKIAALQSAFLIGALSSANHSSGSDGDIRSLRLIQRHRNADSATIECECAVWIIRDQQRRTPKWICIGSSVEGKRIISHHQHMSSTHSHTAASVSSSSSVTAPPTMTTMTGMMMLSDRYSHVKEQMMKMQPMTMTMQNNTDSRLDLSLLSDSGIDRSIDHTLPPFDIHWHADIDDTAPVSPPAKIAKTFHDFSDNGTMSEGVDDRDEYRYDPLNVLPAFDGSQPLSPIFHQDLAD